MQVKCKSKRIPRYVPVKNIGGTPMEEYVKFKIEYCVNMINIYANQKGEGAKEQWSYWAGQLVAWQQALEHIR